MRYAAYVPLDEIERHPRTPPLGRNGILADRIPHHNPDSWDRARARRAESLVASDGNDAIAMRSSMRGAGTPVTVGSGELSSWSRRRWMIPDASLSGV